MASTVSTQPPTANGEAPVIQLTGDEILAAFNDVRDDAVVQDSDGTRAVNYWYADGRLVNNWANESDSGTVKANWRVEDDLRCVTIVSGLPERVDVETCGPVHRRGDQYLSFNQDGSVHGVHTLTPLPPSATEIIRFEALVAIVVALLFIAWCRRTREQAIFTSALFLMPLIYIAFALYGDTRAVALTELAWAAPICLIALSPRLLSNERAWHVLAIGWLLHGIYDIYHDMLFINHGIPLWYPVLCGVFDFVVSVYLFYRGQKVSIEREGFQVDHCHTQERSRQ